MVTSLVAGFAMWAMSAHGSDAAARLFPTDLPPRDWTFFDASGFSKPACGVVYRLSDTVTNGMALGSIDTGCIDLETSGLLGYCTIFNTHVPRRGPLNVPILGLHVGDSTWVLCDKHPKEGSGGAQKPVEPVLMDLSLDGVKTAKEIHYWGHYPVADLEFDTDAPVEVGLRAWTPFLPGHLLESLTPGIVFEVRLRNTSKENQTGTFAFSFPGPTAKEAGANHFERNAIDKPYRGIEVKSPNANYILGVTNERKARFGGELGSSGPAWSRISNSLPESKDDQAGSSCAVDFDLAPGHGKVVRFLLAWNAPTWKGGGFNASDAGGTFTHMYTKYYPSTRDAANTLAQDHKELLRRVLAWQQVVYTDNKLPIWLRDSLVNVLYMITEDGYWAQKSSALPDWVQPANGLFGLNECPRGCPQIECIPCSFYGSLPLPYFFPELALSTLRGYEGYQYSDGAPPWIFGGCTGNTPPINFNTPTRGYQFATNGISLVAQVDRFLLCRDTPDKTYLKEFYPMVKKCMEWTVKLRTTPQYSVGERIISMPDNNVGTEWFEAPEPGWHGMTSHVAGLHLAQLRITERMAKEMGDTAFATQCEQWISEAQLAMEQRLWTGSYYLNYVEPESNTKSDFVFGYQLDGEWVTDHHGLPGTMPDDHVKKVLDTITRCNVAVTKYGAVNYANANGTPAVVKGYGTYSYFPPEALMLSMNYMYEGQRAFGIELARRVWHNIVCLQGYTWDLPNIMRGDVDTGERTFGNDYYQDMMLWALPAAIDGDIVSGPVKPGGLVDRVVAAAGK